MQALKALVIGMGILILVAMGVVAVTIYQRFSTRLDAEEAAAGAEAEGAPETAAPARPRMFGTRELGLPSGARIESMVAEGDRLFLHLRLRDGRYQVLVVDVTDGSRLGTLNLEPAP